MGTKNVYVSNGQDWMWVRLTAMAETSNISISNLVHKAIEEFIQRNPEDGGQGGELAQLHERLASIEERVQRAEMVIDGTSEGLVQQTGRMQQQIGELARHTGLDRIMSGFDE